MVKKHFKNIEEALKELRPNDKVLRMVIQVASSGLLCLS